MDHHEIQPPFPCVSPGMEHAISLREAPSTPWTASKRPAFLGFAPERVGDAFMPGQDELNQWMHAVATSSDREAFAALFRHFAPRIKGFLVRGGCNDATAEELTQETMVALWRRAASFDPLRARLSTWIFTIARHLHLDQHRRAHGLNVVGADWDADQQPADQDLSPHQQALAAQRESHVRDAMAALPPEQIAVLQLSYFEDEPHARIADVLGIPLGTVKSRIRIAVAQLRRHLEEFES
jgi:RNA polymerase sigma factor (sigma-70 family)